MRWFFGFLIAAAFTIPSQIDFNQNVTGSIKRKTSAKLGDVVSALDFLKCDGTTDDSAALANMFAMGARTYVIDGSAGMVCVVNAPVTLPSGATLVGLNRPQLKSTVAGKHIISVASGSSNVTIQGIRFLGANGTTVPTVSVSGADPTNNGLVTVIASTDVRIEDNEFDTFYNGVTATQSTRVWITKNKITNWTFIGIFAGKTNDFTIDHNTVQGCLAAGATNNYGISATGDQNGGTTQFRSSISFNKIKDIPSWDGIGSHDVDGMQIIGNDIRNVRMGIDVGHFAVTNFVSKITVADNYIEGTTTDTWGGTAASMGGILVNGQDATHQVEAATITGNIVNNFFGATGMLSAGLGFGSIVVGHINRATIVGNAVRNAGATYTDQAGIYTASATLNGVTIVGNTVQGAMARGGIRLDVATADEVSIGSNTVQQTTSTDPGVKITNSTINHLGLGPLASNSSAPFVQSSNTMAIDPVVINGNSTVGDAANTGDVRLILDSRTGNATNTPADDVVVQFNRGGVRKWDVGLNWAGANDDGLDFSWNNSTHVFGLTTTGVRPDRAGFKHKRVAVGCTTGAAIGAACTSAALSWTSAFADANYTIVCTLTGPTGQPHISSVAQIAASFTVTIAADTAVGATGTVDCIAVHD